MSTDFSVAYRAPGIVDVLMPKQALPSPPGNYDGYRLKASPQFDGTPAFVTILTANIGKGYLDPAVDRRKLNSFPGQAKVRATFNPDTFTTGEPIDAGIADASQFWMRFTPVDQGVEGPDSDPTLILTPAQRQGTARIAIAGTAPAAASVAGSLRLCLGRRMQDFVIQNNGGNPLFVAFTEGSAEVEVAAGETYSFRESSQSVLFIRGSGGTTDMTASFTVAQSYY